MPAPSDLPTFATDENHSTGPHIGTPNKVPFTEGELAEGNVAETFAQSRKFNWWMNLVGQWISYIYNEVVGRFCADYIIGSVADLVAAGATGSGPYTLVEDGHYHFKDPSDLNAKVIVPVGVEALFTGRWTPTTAVANPIQVAGELTLRGFHLEQEVGTPDGDYLIDWAGGTVLIQGGTYNNNNSATTGTLFYKSATGGTFKVLGANLNAASIVCRAASALGDRFELLGCTINGGYVFYADGTDNTSIVCKGSTITSDTSVLDVEDNTPIPLIEFVANTVLLTTSTDRLFTTDANSGSNPSVIDLIISDNTIYAPTTTVALIKFSWSNQLPESFTLLNNRAWAPSGSWVQNGGAATDPGYLWRGNVFNGTLQAETPSTPHVAHAAATNVHGVSEVADAADLTAHTGNTSNPHGTDIGNLGAGTLAELNTAVTDATLVASGAIVNADINASAAIALSKLATLSTAASATAALDDVAVFGDTSDSGIVKRATLAGILTMLTGNQSLSGATATYNNYDAGFNVTVPQVRTLQVVPDASAVITITGIGAAAPGSVLIINSSQSSGSRVVLSHSSGGSSSANQFINVNSGDVVLAFAARASAAYVYTGSRWRPIGDGQLFQDDKFHIYDSGDYTKKVRLEVGSITTGTTRTITVPNADVNLGNIAANTAELAVRAATFASLTGATATYDDYDPGHDADLDQDVRIAVDPDASSTITITGVVAGATGQRLHIFMSSTSATESCAVTDSGAGSAAANRFLTLSSATQTLQQGSARRGLVAFYSPSKWMQAG